MKSVTIIDYDMSNIDSVARAIQDCGGQPTITNKEEIIKNADKIILPGVGSFYDAMTNLKKYNLDKILYEQVIEEQIPFLGICLGMQLLATKGYEVDTTNGLGWIDGEVKLFKPLDKSTRIPHIGWNNVTYKKKSLLFENVPSGKDFYFVHSFHFVPKHVDEIIATTPYCGEFVSAIEKDNIFGVQFHPEKSQKVGFAILKNFLSI